MVENLFNGIVEALFGTDPSGSMQRMAATIFLIVGTIGGTISGVLAYFEFTKSKKFSGKFWILLAAALLGLVLAGLGLNFFLGLSNAVKNNL